jgi:DNA-directed RNA polymerase specialized sigma24 family protein
MPTIPMSETTGATEQPKAASASPFVSTRWTVVLTAAEPESPAAREAFGNLYRDYWSPLYAFVRRRGHEPPAAEDITQDFFAALLEKQRLNGLTREGGKFRSFLLTALKHHLANEWDRSRAARRGGGVSPLSLDESAAESAYQTVAALTAEPDELFDRQWALSVLALTRQRLEAELAQAGKGALASTLGPGLLGGASTGAYPELAERLGLTEAALKVTIHRLRKRFGELLRQEIARTVDDPAEVPAELRHLITVVGRGG